MAKYTLFLLVKVLFGSEYMTYIYQ